MNHRNFKYIIVGAGLTGASAIEGIREVDQNGPILLVGGEKHFPYHRPPLTKKLWFGAKKVEEIFVRDEKYYGDNGTTVKPGSFVVEIDSTKKLAVDDQGESYSYERLLLATGGVPRTLPIPGGNLDGVFYYRYLDDYLRIRAQEVRQKSAVVIGGGFIGSEIAAALNVTGYEVTMIFPTPTIADRVFPGRLAREIQKRFQEKGIRILNGRKPTAIAPRGDGVLVSTDRSDRVEAAIVIVGVGIDPEVKTALSAGVAVENGVIVNGRLQSSNPDIYAAGDNAYFPYEALGKSMRVEHWDNALNQGKQAGRNMAGAGEAYRYMPYFFSDLFEFGYEAVGDVRSDLDIVEDWEKENDTGVLYYLEGGKLRGAMMCNVWNRVEEARDLIRRGDRVEPGELVGAIAKGAK